MENKQVFRKGILVGLFKLINRIPLEKPSVLKERAETLCARGIQYCDLIETEVDQHGHISRTTYMHIEELIVKLDDFGCQLLNNKINNSWPDVVYRAEHELESILEANSFLFMWWSSSSIIKKQLSINQFFDFEMA